MNTEVIEFKLLPELYQGKTISMKLYFKNPSFISSSSDFDILEVIVKKTEYVELNSNKIILSQN